MNIKNISMIKLRFLFVAAILFSLISCEKEYSSENIDNTGNDQIVGIDCRMSRIIFTDTSNNKGIGSIEAIINSLDYLTGVTRFDSISNTIEYTTTTALSNDTVFIDFNNRDEYFIVDINKRISKMHGLVDPTDNLSPQFDVTYLYNSEGFLVTKSYFFTSFPTVAFYQVDYTYTAGNLTHMKGTDLTNGDLIVDADVSYYSNIIPKRFIYIFPDEQAYANFTQFYNFGSKNFNAPKTLKVRNYDPGNVVRDSLVSDFSNYILSRDTYVLSVQMGGDDQQSIPAAKGKLSFSYKCK